MRWHRQRQVLRDHTLLIASRTALYGVVDAEAGAERVAHEVDRRRLRERARRMPLGLVQRVRQQPQHRQTGRTGEAVHFGIEDLQGRLVVDAVGGLAAGADEDQI